MFSNYFKIAVRNLLKYKTYSFINLAGLALGIACCVLILLFIQDELSYDRFHVNADRIYRVGNAGKFGNEIWRGARTPHPLGPALLAEFSEVQQAVRFSRLYQPLLQYGEKKFVESRFFYADPAVFEVFTFPLLQGDPRTALTQPYTVVITPEMAEKYFGDSDPLGQTLTVAKVGDFQITGVLKNIPTNSHLNFDFLASYATLHAQNHANLDKWGAIVISTYILLAQPNQAEALTAKLPTLVAKYQSQSQGATQELFLTRLRDLHLRSGFHGELGTVGNLTTIYLLAVIAGFILLIACINFMNLATARSLRRAREVGVRKVMGAYRLQIIRQFLGEALLLSFGALLLALPLAELLLPKFNQLVSKNLSLHLGDNLLAAGIFAGLGLVVGVLAGSYPALALSQFRPAEVLKSQARSRPAAARLRQILVVAQFAISIIFIVSTLIVGAQLDFLHNTALGFKKEQVVVLPIQDRSVNARYATIKQELQKNANILSVAATSQLPGTGQGEYFYQVEGQSEMITLPTYFIDSDFMSTLGIELAAGRSFSAQLATDATSAFMINETAARQFGWTDPIGKSINWDDRKKGTVIGVVKDFHTLSLHEKIEPLIIQLFPEPLYANYIIARMTAHEIPQTLAFIKEKWQAFDPQYPFKYSFLDADFDQLYRAEERLAQIFSYSAVLAIFIACLGLLGLASFTAEQRVKEIGVRKVLGASVAQIIILLSRDFARLVGVAFIVATPLAYFAMQRWLQNFAYRTNIEWQTFLWAGLLALITACLTVSYQAAKAALANPVEALRYE